MGFSRIEDVDRRKKEFPPYKMVDKVNTNFIYFSFFIVMKAHKISNCVDFFRLK